METSETSVYQESIVDACIKKHGTLLISILQEVQKYYNYLPVDVLNILSEKLEMSLRDIYGVASFYRSFSFSPKGDHVLTTCLGTACHVRGGQKIADSINNELNINSGETTKDMMFTHETANCLGCCAIGPIVMVDGEYHSGIRPGSIKKFIKEIRSGSDRVRKDKSRLDFPIEVSCPRCNHSLMKPEHIIDNLPCIHVTISYNRKHGWLRLSSLYGSFSFECEIEVPFETELNFFCPHCHEDLGGSSECPECGAKMILMIVRGGGTVQICPRRGCKGHLLDT
ncbi:NAD(P)H-dependent oxidoreductase subunit E [Bacteroidota bacterium]